MLRTSLGGLKGLRESKQQLVKPHANDSGNEMKNRKILWESYGIN